MAVHLVQQELRKKTRIVVSRIAQMILGEIPQLRAFVLFPKRNQSAVGCHYQLLKATP
jgi:hypothetical protein